MKGFWILWFILLSVSVSANSYQTIGIKSVANAANEFVDLEVGDIYFDGIPFFLEPTNPAFVSTDHYSAPSPDSISLSTDLSGVVSVYLLINGGNMYIDSLGNQAGYLRLIGSILTFDIPLVCGVNVREWSPYNYNAVINCLTDPLAREVWSGSWNGWIVVPGRIDLYTVLLPEIFGSLRSIEMYDTSDVTGLNLYGVTVEIVPEPSSFLALGGGLIGLFKLKKRA